MKKLFVAIASFFLISCSDKKEFIYYTYENETITRLNKEPNEIYFYYGKYENGEKLPNSYIKASFSGFDGGMGGYLIFNKDKTIEIIRVYDSFSKIGNDKYMLLNDTMKNVDFINWKGKVDENYDNVIELSDILETEKLINYKNKTKVKAIYPND